MAPAPNPQAQPAQQPVKLEHSSQQHDIATQANAFPSPGSQHTQSTQNPGHSDPNRKPTGANGASGRSSIAGGETAQNGTRVSVESGSPALGRDVSMDQSASLPPGSSKSKAAARATAPRRLVPGAKSLLLESDVKSMKEAAIKRIKKIKSVDCTSDIKIEANRVIQSIKDYDTASAPSSFRIVRRFYNVPKNGGAVSAGEMVATLAFWNKIPPNLPERTQLHPDVMDLKTMNQCAKWLNLPPAIADPKIKAVSKRPANKNATTSANSNSTDTGDADGTALGNASSDASNVKTLVPIGNNSKTLTARPTQDHVGSDNSTGANDARPTRRSSPDHALGSNRTAPEPRDDRRASAPSNHPDLRDDRHASAPVIHTGQHEPTGASRPRDGSSIQAAIEGDRDAQDSSHTSPSDEKQPDVLTLMDQRDAYMTQSSHMIRVKLNADAAEKDKLKRKIQDYEEVLRQEKKARTDEIELKVQRLEAQLARRDNDISFIENQYSALQERNSTLEKENSTLEMENSSLKKDKSTLEEDKSALKKENSSLKGQVAALKGGCNGCQL